MQTLRDTFEFANAAGLWWLLGAVVAAALLAWLAAWRRRARVLLAEQALLARIAPAVAENRGLLRGALVVAACAALALALADPRAGDRIEKVEQSGIDIMVVVDVSRSMLAEDASPSRLDRAKQFAADLVEALGGDRVGLIEFAGVATMRCPLTFNHRSFLTQLEALSPQASARGGSMLGDAVRLASASLDAEGVGKAIVILTDGEDMESEPVEAAAAAASEKSIRVVTIGIGDSGEGARIPVLEGGQRRYLVHEGREVWTRMDPSLLRRMADAADGFFIDAGTGQADMAQLSRVLASGLDRATRDERDVAVKDPLFQWLAAIALIALLIECAVSPRPAQMRGGAYPARPAGGSSAP
ncbi:MAG: VWA domain-containing protein [Planctomycetota bacterium]